MDIFSLLQTSSKKLSNAFYFHEVDTLANSVNPEQATILGAIKSEFL